MRLRADAAARPLPPAFTATLRRLHSGDPQVGIDGKVYPADRISGAMPESGIALFNLSRRIQAKRTLEIGFAQGFSTLYLLAALPADGFHTAIDPFEVTGWHGVGLKNVEVAGAKGRFRFLEQFSFAALPVLEAKGERFDLIFIDGDHRFDGIMVDFTLSDYLCHAGSVIALHDLHLPATQKVVAWISSNRPDYLEISRAGDIIAFQKAPESRTDWRSNPFVPF